MDVFARTYRKWASAAFWGVLALRGSEAMATEWVIQNPPPVTPLFSDPNNWSTLAVPGPDGVAQFPNGGLVYFNADANTGQLTITSGTQCTNFYLGIQPFATPPSGTPYTYTISGLGSSGTATNSFNAFIYDSFNVSVFGGNISIPNSGMQLSNSSVNVSSFGSIAASGTTEIDGGSVLTVGNPHGQIGDSSTANFSAGTLLVANRGTGTLAVGLLGSVSVAQDVSVAPQPDSAGLLDVQGGGRLTVLGTAYVGGSAAGAGGTGNLEVGVNNGGSTFSGAQAKVYHLVVYAGSSVITSTCSNIFTNASDIAGSLKLQSNGGFRAESAINLMAGSKTIEDPSASLSSPTITLSAGAIFSGAGRINGNFINAGEVDASGLTITPVGVISSFNTPSASYAQLSSGVLSGTAGDALMTINGSASVSGTLQLLFSAPGSVHSGDSFPVISASSITGSFDTIDLIGLTGFTATFSNVTGRVTLTGGNSDNNAGSVPEPSCAVLLGLAEVGLLLRLRPR